MADYLIYFIPGIFSFSLYKLIKNSIPPIENEINTLIKYLLLSIESYAWMLCSILIFEREFNFNSNLSSVSVNVIGSIKVWRFIVYLSIGVLMPIVIRLIRDYLSKKNGNLVGSIAYSESFMKDVFSYFDKSGTAFDVSNLSVRKIQSMVRKGEIKKYPRPIKIFKGGIEIQSGQIQTYYDRPWEYKEFYLDTSKIVEADFIEHTNTYIDLKEDIVIEIYNFSKRS